MITFIHLSRETEDLARRLAEAQRVPDDIAVRQALEDRARLLPELRKPKDCSPEAVAKRRARMDQLAAEIATLPLLDLRPTQDIVDDLNPL